MDRPRAAAPERFLTRPEIVTVCPCCRKDGVTDVTVTLSGAEFDSVGAACPACAVVEPATVGSTAHSAAATVAASLTMGEQAMALIVLRLAGSAGRAASTSHLSDLKSGLPGFRPGPVCAYPRCPCTIPHL